MKKVLKFDVGKDGFEMMILVLAITSSLVLVIGTYFLITTFHF